MSRKALVVLSGGQDSTTCLYWALQNYEDVHAVTFDYGQRHRREIDSARMIADMAGLRGHKHEVVEIGAILRGTSPLVSNAPLEQYADHTTLPGGLEKTFVPMRNQLFLTLAANRAFCIGASVLVTGVCQEDFGGYPDCRREFIDALELACRLGTFTREAGFEQPIEGHTTGFPDYDQLYEAPFKILTPLMFMTKAQSVQFALELPGCYKALAYSHTSYDGEYPPAGKDHATLLRAKGFIEADIPDPLVLRACNEGAMPLPETPNYRQGLVEQYIGWI